MRLSKKAEFQKKFLRNIDDYKIEKRLDSGQFGVVYLIQNKVTHQQFVAKVLQFKGSGDKYKQMIDREVGILMHFQHPTIIPFYGFSPVDFNKEKQFTIFMEVAKKGSLASILQKVRLSLADSDYDQTARQIILIGIARGMMYLHKHHIIHRDLKPGNILLDENFHPYITDFGISKFYEPQDYLNQTQSCGTPAYMAPEVIRGNEYNAKVDVYSFGILMYEVVTDCDPYPDLTGSESQIKEYLLNPENRPKFKVPIKESIQELIERCWSENPKNRPTFEEIFNKLAFNEEESI